MKSFDQSSQKVEQLHEEVRMRLKQKQTPEQIYNSLEEKGLEPYYIKTIIQNVEDEKDDKKSFRNSMIMGIGYIVGGIVINIFSYKFAVESNSFVFYIFWGIVVVGIVTVIRGFILYRK